MKAGRSRKVEQCGEVVAAIINGEQPPSTFTERRIAARLLTGLGVDRAAIAFLLGVDVRSVSRYTRHESA